MNKSKYLAWIDLEMTGLDFRQYTILEIAVLITDSDLNVVAQGPDIIINHPQIILDGMNQFVFDMHNSSGLLDQVARSQIHMEQAEKEVLSFLSKYGEPNTMPLCGNSIWQDKLFLINYMPNLINFFHYRIIDVSSIKELIKRWYGESVEFKKAKKHRALDDILESVAELKFYRQNYFI